MAADPLLLEFADSRPAELAALTADADTDAVSELLSGLPSSTAAQLAARLPSRLLLQILAVHPAHLTGDMLFNAKHDDAIALVAHLQEARYAEILAASPRSHRGKLNRLFEFPLHTLSALASPGFIRVNENTSCESVCGELTASSETQPRPIFSVDDNGAYRGLVNVFALMAAHNQGKPVKSVSTPVTPFNGDLSATAALESPEWLEHLALPVTDAKQRIIGTVTRAQLQRLVPDTGARRHGLEALLSELAAAYLRFCADVLTSLFSRAAK